MKLSDRLLGNSGETPHVTDGTFSEGKKAKTSHVSHACATHKVEVSISSLSERFLKFSTPPRAQVTNGTFLNGKPDEAAIVGWINSHPPDLPDVQNHCAVCGEFVPVYDTGWAILGDGAFIHYGGKHGLKCWREWQEIRRRQAIAALAEERR